MDVLALFLTNSDTLEPYSKITHNQLSLVSQGMVANGVVVELMGPLLEGGHAGLGREEALASILEQCISVI